MSDYIGVRNFGNHEDLKRDLLFFDRVCYPNLLDNLRWLTEENTPKASATAKALESLAEDGIIFAPERYKKSLYLNNIEYGTFHKLHEDALKKTAKTLSPVTRFFKEQGGSSISSEPKDLAKPFEDYVEATGDLHTFTQFCNIAMHVCDYDARLIAIELRNDENKNAIPLLVSDSITKEFPGTRRTAIARLVISQLPTPAPETSFHEVIELRNDPYLRADYMALQKWITDLSKAEHSLTEVEENIEYLAVQFRRHMEVQKIKIGVGCTETIVVIVAELLEDLVKFKWSKAVRALFSISKKQAMLLESEAKAPGKEVAYLVKSADLVWRQ